VFLELAVIALIGLTSCGSKPSAPRVNLGKDHCAHCDMVIEDVRAAGVIAGERTRFYDDPGCLLDDRAEHAELASRPAFVHDAATDDPDAWIPLDRAWFVLAPSIRTPMGSELEAHASRARAEARAGEAHGEAIPPEQIAARRRAWREARYGGGK